MTSRDLEQPVRDLDEASRPRVAMGVPLTPAQQAPGRHLRMIHDALRRELAELRGRVAAVERGESGIGDVRQSISHLTMRTTYETLGSFCGQYCQIVTLHHTIEDRHLFPAVAAHAAFRPVTDRLAAEHVTIHEVLVDLDAAVLRVEDDAAAFDRLGRLVDELATLLLSHLTYEEDELSEPLGLFGIGV
jgi:Hemerythrin HHE cation binding domain